MFDAASNSGYQAASSLYSWSHTCTGNNQYLVVGVAMLSLAQTVSGITYNGVSLTYLGSKNSISGAARVELWGLVNPASGSHTIAVTLSGSIVSCAAAISHYNIYQANPYQNFSSAQATNVGAADATVNVTVSKNGSFLVSMVCTDDGSITSNNTVRANVTGAGGSGGLSNTSANTPGTPSISWTGVGALATWAIAAIALIPDQNNVGGGFRSFPVF